MANEEEAKEDLVGIIFNSLRIVFLLLSVSVFIKVPYLVEYICVCV